MNKIQIIFFNPPKNELTRKANNIKAKNRLATSSRAEMYLLAHCVPQRQGEISGTRPVDQKDSIRNIKHF